MSSASSARTAPARRPRCASRSACCAADAGTITLGRPLDHRELPRQTWGYLPEERGLYPQMTVLDQLVFFAGL